MTLQELSEHYQLRAQLEKDEDILYNLRMAAIPSAHGKVTGWISVDDAKAGAGLRDQTTDSRGLTKIVIDYASNVQAMAVYNLAQQLDLVAPGYYRSRYIDAAKTAQYIEIGQISAGDAEHVTTLCKKAAIEYKTAA